MILDDYHLLAACRETVGDFLADRGIDPPLRDIDRVGLPQGLTCLHRGTSSWGPRHDRAGSRGGGRPEAPAGVSRGRRWLQAILYVAPVIGFVSAGYAHRWITDDGFIYLRAVQQIRAGNGLVFNAGERVEAFTGSLWVALLAVADLVTPVRLELLAVFLGLACGAAGLAFAIAGARRVQGGQDLFVPLGALVFVVITPVWVFATSGLETGLTVGWLGACLWLLASWARTPATLMSLPSAAVLGLGWLGRRTWRSSARAS